MMRCVTARPGPREAGAASRGATDGHLVAPSHCNSGLVLWAVLGARFLRTPDLHTACWALCSRATAWQGRLQEGCVWLCRGLGDYDSMLGCYPRVVVML